MRVRVTNMSRAARGFHTADGGTVLLEPGASGDLDLAHHPAHDAWVKAGEVTAVPLNGAETASVGPGRDRTSRRGRDV